MDYYFKNIRMFLSNAALITEYMHYDHGNSATDSPGWLTFYSSDMEVQDVCLILNLKIGKYRNLYKI